MFPSQGTQRGQEERGDSRSVGQVGVQDPTGMKRERAVPGAGSEHTRQAPSRLLEDVPGWWPGHSHLQAVLLTHAGEWCRQQAPENGVSS